MNSVEERKQAISNMMGVSPQNSAEGNGSSGETDYYKNLKNESYKAMLDSEIQASVAKEQGLKYVQNGLMANGLANQGIAESSKLGLLNSYNKALSEAQATHNQNMVSIGEQEANALKQENKDNFESLTTLMSGVSDSDSLNKVLGHYDISVDKEGNLSGNGYEALDESSRKQLAALYSIYSKELGGASTSSSQASVDYFTQADSIQDKNSDEYKVAFGKGNYNAMKSAGYYVQGFNDNGRKNNDIDITLGYNTRNKDHEYDLLCGEPATGAESSILDQIADDKQSGTLAYHDGKLFIYSTKDGWINVVGDRDDVNSLIEELKNKYGIK